MESADNPYEDLQPMDLSEALFEKLEGLDLQTVETIIVQVKDLTQSNISSAAKWNGYVRVISGALRSAGLIARIAAAT